jgi:hypothetical protein
MSPINNFHSFCNSLIPPNTENSILPASLVTSCMWAHISAVKKRVSLKPLYRSYLVMSYAAVSGVLNNIFGGGVYTGIFRGGGVQQIKLRTEGRENGDRGSVAPSEGLHSLCKWMKPIFWLGCYGCIFHGTGNSAQLWQNFGISRGGGG